jgi:hypothetical protein
MPFVKNKFLNLTRSQHQFLCLEQGAIAEWQGAREDKKFVTQPTQSSRDYYI